VPVALALVALALVAVTTHDEGTMMDEAGPSFPAARIAAPDWTDTGTGRASSLVADTALAVTARDVPAAAPGCDDPAHPTARTGSTETSTAPELMVRTRRFIADSTPEGAAALRRLGQEILTLVPTLLPSSGLPQILLDLGRHFIIDAGR
jgi:hypothetical protein